MTIPSFPRLRAQDPVKAELVSRLQDNAGTTLDALAAVPLLGGVLLTGLVLASGANIVSHQLGRVPMGWFPVRVRASATLFDTQDTNTTPSLTLLLTASAAVTVDLWVF